jgi:hypothetical protein
LALFGRRPIQRMAAIVFTGIQKPAQMRKSRKMARQLVLPHVGRT